jgi:hypothetical protein
MIFNVSESKSIRQFRIIQFLQTCFHINASFLSLHAEMHADAIYFAENSR